MEEQRKQAELEQSQKRAAGKKTRVSEGMQKRMSRMLDLDHNIAQRRVLMDEALKKGYYDDHKEVARKGNKLWEASRVMKAQNVSPLIPNIAGKTLSKESTDLISIVTKNKVTLVAFLFNAYGERHIKTFIDPFISGFKAVEGIDYFRVVVEENSIKAAVLKPLVPYMRWSVDKDVRPKQMMVFENVTAQRVRCGMSNPVVGWVNLVDSTGRIRWQAHGPAKEHELETLGRLTRELAGLPPKPVVVKTTVESGFGDVAGGEGGVTKK
ncbi:Mitochondrial ATPase complex subunit atp10, partial [Rhizophlyctis rosea]